MSEEQIKLEIVRRVNRIASDYPDYFFAWDGKNIRISKLEKKKKSDRLDSK